MEISCFYSHEYNRMKSRGKQVFFSTATLTKRVFGCRMNAHNKAMKTLEIST